LTLAKSLKITILLAFLVSGVGHIYLGTIKRGTIILVVGIALWLIVPLFVPFPFSLVITMAYWIMQIVDAYLVYKKMDSGQARITDFKR
jgi:TM2 domain-containing membrane protein YozV